MTSWECQDLENVPFFHALFRRTRVRMVLEASSATSWDGSFRSSRSFSTARAKIWGGISVFDSAFTADKRTKELLSSKKRQDIRAPAGKFYERRDSGAPDFRGNIFYEHV